MLLWSTAIFAGLMLSPNQTAYPTNTVSLDVPFTRLPTVVDQLGKQLGQKMVVGSRLANEPILIRYKGKPANVLMEKLASITQANWSYQDGTWTLDRTGDQQQALVSADVQTLISTWKESLKNGEGEAGGAPAFMEAQEAISAPSAPIQQGIAEQEVEATQPEVPPRMDITGEQMLGFLTEDDWRGFAAMDIGKEVIYSDNPTTAQRLFQKSPACLRLIQENNKTDKRPKKFVPQPRDRVTMLVRRLTVDTLTLDLQYVRGKSILSGQGMFLNGLARAEANAPKWNERDKKILINPTDSMVRFVGGQGSEINRLYENIPSDFLEKVRMPAVYDPIGFGFNDLFRAAAADQLSDVVALVPDYGINQALLVRVADKSVPLSVLDSVRGVQWEKSDGLMVVRPTLPGLASVFRLDRRKYQQLIQSNPIQSGVTLTTLMDLAKLRPEDYPIISGSMMCGLSYRRSAMNFGDDELMGRLLRFMSGFSASQLQILNSGKRLSFRDLSNVAREEACQLIRRMGPASVPNELPNPNEGFDTLFADLTPAEGMVAFDVSDMLTPTAVNQTSWIAIRSQSTAEAMAVKRGALELEMLQFMGPNEIAMIEQISKMPEFAPLSSLLPNVTMLRPATRRLWYIELGLNPQAGTRMRLDEHIPGGNPDGIPLEQFPKEFQELLKKAREGMQFMGNEGGPANGGDPLSR